MKRTARKSSGFTLLELTLVLLVIAVVLAAAAPSLSGWGRGSKQRDAAENFLAIARWARGQAVTDAAVHRLYVDSSAGTYWVTMQDNESFVRVPSSLGQVFSVGEEMRIEMTSLQGEPMQYVDFFPTGRTQPARVKVTLNDGSAIQLECPTPAEQFRMVTQQEQLQ